MKVFFLAFMLCLLPGCASTGVEFGDNEATVAGHDVVMEKKPTIFHATTLDNARMAARRALLYVGCEIDKERPFLVSGERLHGGTIEFFLLPKGDDIHVWVDSGRWNDEAMMEMGRILSVPGGR